MRDAMRAVCKAHETSFDDFVGALNAFTTIYPVPEVGAPEPEVVVAVFVAQGSFSFFLEAV